MIRFWQMVAALTPGGGIVGGILSVFATCIRWALEFVMWIFRSAKAALAVPMTYPIIAAVAVGGFVGGHVDGSKPAKVLARDIVIVKADREHLAKRLASVSVDLAAAEERARKLENSVTVPAISATPAKLQESVAKKRVKPATRSTMPKADDASFSWPFKLF